MDSRSGLDLVLLAILGFAVWRGFRTGAAVQIVGTVGLLIAFVFGSTLMAPAGTLATSVFGISDRAGPVIGFVLVFAITLASVFILGKTVEAAFRTMRLGVVEKSLGAVLAGFKAALGLSVALMVTGFSPFPGGNPWLIGTETRESSILYEPIREIGPVTWEVVRGVTPAVQAQLHDLFGTYSEEEDI
ncbi:hypothetical protein BH23BAC4_BH23BAC4_06740 [soil metagenome]